MLVFTETTSGSRSTVTAEQDRAHYIFIHSGEPGHDRVWYVPADDSGHRAGRRPAPREAGIEYRVEHSISPDEFLIVTNDGAAEFRLMAAPAYMPPGQWTELAAARPGERLVRTDPCSPTT